MKRVMLIVVLMALGAAALFGEVFDFKLTNKTGADIVELYVAPSGEEEWGDDILGEEGLGNGATVKVTFPEEYEAQLLELDVDKYDLRAVMEDGSDHVWGGLKLETINSITLSLDKSGKAVAAIK